MIRKASWKLIGPLLMSMATFAFSPTADASSGSGTLLEVVIETGSAGFARIRLSGGAITARPGCHNGSGYTTHYAFEVSSAKGKALLSTATAAMLAGKTVVVSGDGVNCTNTGPVTLETLNSLVVFN